MSDRVRIVSAAGEGLLPWIPDLARLRITIFREYPYLYEGDAEYEAKYLETYRRAEGSLVVIVADGARVVGASTAVPLTEETEEVRAPFLAAGIASSEVFYFGESMLLPEYRGRGLGTRFFLHREAHARSFAADPTTEFGPLRWLAFCAVERAADDPRRPTDHRPLDEFWQGRGFQRRPDVRTTFAWKEIGEDAMSPKPMVFWTKEITPPATPER